MNYAEKLYVQDVVFEWFMAAGHLMVASATRQIKTNRRVFVYAMNVCTIIIKQNSNR